MNRTIPELLYRASSLGNAPGAAPPTYNAETRSVDVTIATESPVMMWDWDYGEIPETLLMKGCRLPKSRQLPLLDTHSRYSTSDVIGSVRDMKIDEVALLGRHVYSSVPRAHEVFIKVGEGHITDNSVGYKVNDYVTVPKGETQTIAGKAYKGPHRVVTSWTPKEDSVCPIGADVNAKFRDEVLAKNPGLPMRAVRSEAMARELRHLLERVYGLPRAATTEEAWEFFLDISMAQHKEIRP